MNMHAALTAVPELTGSRSRPATLGAGRAQRRSVFQVCAGFLNAYILALFTS
jgi:hypothetical protein